jgi:hypothetical protein
MNMIKKIYNLFKGLNIIASQALRSRNFYDDQLNDIKKDKILLGKIMSRLNSQLSGVKNLNEVEFQVYSQWGDDGIIQYLINKLDIPHKTFIEFGVENYKESNTRFLLINDNWSGMVIDGSEENVKFIREDLLSWGYELYAKAAFITKDNINNLLSEFLSFGYDKEIGILSVDIDGNDYYVWDAITVVNPVIVIAEYNSVFGSDKPWSVPYDPSFVRTNAHASKLYYGSSLMSLCDLAEKKGYRFVGCNLAGNNAYYIRNDKVKDLPVVTLEKGFIASKFREYKGTEEQRPSGVKRLDVIKGMPVYNTRTNKIEHIG